MEDLTILDMRPTNEEFLNIIQRDNYRFRAEFTLMSPMSDSVHVSYKLNFKS